MFCKNCGKELPDSAKFCSGCGQSIVAAQPQQTPVQPYASAPITPQQAPKKKKTGLIIGIIVAVVVLIGAVIGALFGFGIIGGDDDSKDKKDRSEKKTETTVEVEETTEGQPEASAGGALYDNNGVVVTFDHVDDESIYLSVENNYGEEITVSSHNVAVNGIMLETSLFEKLHDGDKITAEIDWKNEGEKCGIEEVKNFIIDVYYYDAEYNTIDTSEPITVDCGDINFKQQIPDIGEEILNKNNIKVYYQGIEEGEYLYKTEAKIVFVNETDKIITADVSGGKINGKDTSWFLYRDIYPGCSMVDTAGQDEKELKDIKTAVFTISVFDQDYNSIVSSEDSAEVTVK